MFLPLAERLEEQENLSAYHRKLEAWRIMFSKLKKKNCEIIMRLHFFSAYFYALIYSSICPLTELILL